MIPPPPRRRWDYRDDCQAAPRRGEMLAIPRTRNRSAPSRARLSVTFPISARNVPLMVKTAA